MISPTHSLLTQSQDASEAKFSVNGDGFGLAWYQKGETAPGLYRDVSPAWSDGNLPSICRMVQAPIFLAHVRASTGTETSRANCHPFTHGRWSFVHNGQLGEYRRNRRELENSLPDEFYHMRRGSTDSELIFWLMMSEWLEADPEEAIAVTLARLDRLRRPGDAPDRLTFVMSDGETIYAMRTASDGRAPTLYARQEEDGVVLASEPLESDQSGWVALPKDRLLRFNRDQNQWLGASHAGRAASFSASARVTPISSKR